MLLFDNDKILKIANVLQVHSDIIENKFHNFPPDTVFEVSNAATLDIKTEKELISGYNNAKINSTKEREILLEMYKYIDVFNDPKATGRHIK